ncbi:MAG: DUF2189 domain-containing protein [Alphaproteobacteria bacterium]|nr:DUF2189 domain-containing protein [Alphaproteobacteria bacterium]
MPALVQTTEEAPVIRPDDVWVWTGAGWRDLVRAAPMSLAYGAAFVAIGLAATAGLWALGLSAWIPVAAGAFALLGPLLAVGLYEISRRLEANEPLTWRAILLVKTAAPDQIALLGLILTMSALAWARIAQLLFALLVGDSYVPLTEFSGFVLSTPEGLALAALGTVVGGAIAFLIFALSAFSLPMLVERDIDVVTAINASIAAVRRAPAAMALWAWIIAVATAVGCATGFLGLVVAFPFLGHATWHAYRAVMGRP